MGSFDDLFGGGVTTTKTNTSGSSFTDSSNPFILDAINTAGVLSKTGLSEDILSKMRRRVRGVAGRQNSALRGSTASRLRRQGGTRQENEQILRDLSSSQLGELENSLLGIDFKNEDVKMQGLEMLGGFSRGLTSRSNSSSTSKSTTEQPGGLGLGSLLGLGLDFMGTGGLGTLASIFSSGSKGGGSGNTGYKLKPNFL